MPYMPFGRGSMTATVMTMTAASCDLPKPRCTPTRTRLYWRLNRPVALSSLPVPKSGLQTFVMSHFDIRYGWPHSSDSPA